MGKIISLIKRLIIIIKYSKKVKVMPRSNITVRSVFEGNNYIGYDTAFDGVLGLGTYIGHQSQISGKIGRYCCIASDVKTINGYHPINDFVSIHPAFFNPVNCTGLSFVKKVLFNEFRYADKEKKHGVIIENDVWVGYGALLMAGIKIGNGAVIGAGSVVTKDVAPYTVVGGCPARVIKKRFDDKTIDFLLRDLWWNKPIKWLQVNGHHFSDIHEYRKIIEHEGIGFEEKKL